jgi:hypothetical protein
VVDNDTLNEDGTSEDPSEQHILSTTKKIKKTKPRSDIAEGKKRRQKKKGNKGKNFDKEGKNVYKEIPSPQFSSNSESRRIYPFITEPISQVGGMNIEANITSSDQIDSHNPQNYYHEDQQPSLSLDSQRPSDQPQVDPNIIPPQSEPPTIENLRNIPNEIQYPRVETTEINDERLEVQKIVRMSQSVGIIDIEASIEKKEEGNFIKPQNFINLSLTEICQKMLTPLYQTLIEDIVYNMEQLLSYHPISQCCGLLSSLLPILPKPTT